jgi:hypothetical protein
MLVEIVFLDDVDKVDEGLQLLDVVFLPWMREQVFWRISSRGFRRFRGNCLALSSYCIICHQCLGRPISSQEECIQCWKMWTRSYAFGGREMQTET